MEDEHGSVWEIHSARSFESLLVLRQPRRSAGRFMFQSYEIQKRSQRSESEKRKSEEKGCRLLSYFWIRTLTSDVVYAMMLAAVTWISL